MGACKIQNSEQAIDEYLKRNTHPFKNNWTIRRF